MAKTYWGGEIYNVAGHGPSRVITVGAHSLFLREIDSGKEYSLAKELMPDWVHKEVFAITTEEALVLRAGDKTYNSSGQKPFTVVDVEDGWVTLRDHTGVTHRATSAHLVATVHYVDAALKAAMKTRLREREATRERLVRISELEAEYLREGDVLYTSSTRNGWPVKSVTEDNVIMGKRSNEIIRTKQYVAQSFNVKLSLLKELRKRRVDATTSDYNIAMERATAAQLEREKEFDALLSATNARQQALEDLAELVENNSSKLSL